MHSTCSRDSDRTARGLSPGMRPEYPLLASRKSTNGWAFAGSVLKCGNYFRTVPKLPGWPTFNTLSFCSVTVSELMMPLCLGWTFGDSPISELPFLPHRHRGKDFSLCAFVCSELFPDRPVYNLQVDLLIVCHFSLRQLSQREPVTRSGEHFR